jgi:hypothetical protein
MKKTNQSAKEKSATDRKLMKDLQKLANRIFQAKPCINRIIVTTNIRRNKGNFCAGVYFTRRKAI